MIKFGSLFDGAGTVPFAAAICGAETVWASEIEPFPIAVTKKRFPNMKHLGDITKINGAEIESVDVISFGSPCQDLSMAGKRAGLEGERSGLFMEAVRIIKEMREKTNGRFPTVAIWENVPGAFSSNRGEDFRVVLEEMCRIKDSSAAIPRPASGGVEALGQTQEAFWQTGIPSLGESLMLNTGEYPNAVEESFLWQILAARVPKKYYLSERACRGVLRRSVKSGVVLPPLLLCALLKQGNVTVKMATEMGIRFPPSLAITTTE